MWASMISGQSLREPACPTLRPGRLLRLSAFGLRYAGIIAEGVVGVTTDGVCGSPAFWAKVSRAKTTASSPWRWISRACCSVSAGPRGTGVARVWSIIALAQLVEPRSVTEQSLQKQGTCPLQSAKVLRLLESTLQASQGQRARLEEPCNNQWRNGAVWREVSKLQIKKEPFTAG